MTYVMEGTLYLDVYAVGKNEDAQHAAIHRYCVTFVSIGLSGARKAFLVAKLAVSHWADKSLKLS